MVEGHQCHRVAAAHRQLLVGRSFIARSPNGRFKEGAAAINTKPLQRIEVHGKNLFYFFSSKPTSLLVEPAAASTERDDAASPSRSPNFKSSSSPASSPNAAAADGGSGVGCDDTVVMHVHFGMSGAFRTMSLPGPPPTETTRLELIHKDIGLVAHLSAMTVSHGSLALYKSKAAQLGPDPLREDADKELLWSKLSRSRKPIGLVLMDQSMVAGLGNIYRAEVLFKAGVHPELPACDISRELFDRIWYHSVDLLQRGFVTGSIITVDPDEAKVLGRPWTRRYIYNQKTCGRCKGPVRTWDMATRTVYCCENCQPLNLPEQQQQQQQEVTAAAGGGGGGGAVIALSVARLTAMATARPPRLFRSHCAPDDDDDFNQMPAKLTVKQLKSRLTSLNLDLRGTKPQLVKRLEAALCWKQHQQPTTNATSDTPITALVGAGAVTVAAATQLQRRQPRRERRTAKVDREVDVKEEATEDAEEKVVRVVEVKAVEGNGKAVTLFPAGAGAGSAGFTAAVAKDPSPCAYEVNGSAGADFVAAENDNDSDSAVTLDRAEQILTDSMAVGASRHSSAPSPLHELTRLTVVQLRGRLRELGLPINGIKKTLIARLTAAQQPAVVSDAAPVQQATATAADVSSATDKATAAPAVPLVAREFCTPDSLLPAGGEAATTTMAPPPPRKVARPAKAGPYFLGAAAVGAAAKADPEVSPMPLQGKFETTGTLRATASRGLYDIQPGIRGLEARMASARDAALEKLLANESRAVEHVALEDDEVVDLLSEHPKPNARKRARSLAAAMAAAGGAETEEAGGKRWGGAGGFVYSQ
ncbi:hypothetical protein VaNZ11_012540 [Volvox africanus]|uniref:DNA-(apurinic or apyrimidinic site) lyase n=1 Tax=Volvox africanus TaxID=51714 RepID=A0ABQ5SE95_9CHLO|nr:hypothetical protein VaNZ11_012540 [Volvox africanus]